MWIFSEAGYMSIVAQRDNPKKLLVRFRTREDAEVLVRMFRVYEKQKKLKARACVIRATPQADYPFRVVVGRQRLARYMAWYITTSLAYPNFKSAIATVAGLGRAETYHDVWNVLREQLDERYNGVR